MLAKEDLLVCKTPPNIRDVSLQLYKEFAETYLIDKIFHYPFWMEQNWMLNLQNGVFIIC